MHDTLALSNSIKNRMYCIGLRFNKILENSQFGTSKYMYRYQMNMIVLVMVMVGQFGSL